MEHIPLGARFEACAFFQSKTRKFQNVTAEKIVLGESRLTKIQLGKSKMNDRESSIYDPIKSRACNCEFS